MEIYLLECILCHVQYVGKSEISFNIILNGNKKDMNKLKAILARL